MDLSRLGKQVSFFFWGALVVCTRFSICLCFMSGVISFLVFQREELFSLSFPFALDVVLHRLP